MRCFIALALPQEARETLARVAAELRAALGPAPGRVSRANLAWTRPEAWHLTLAFLGDIDGRALELAAAAVDAAAGLGPLPFSFAGLGGFPPRGPWRVLVAKIEDGGRIAAVHRGVNQALAASAAAEGRPPLNAEWAATARGGPSRGRPFTPHVTLARASRGASISAGLVASSQAAKGFGVSAGSWSIDRCALFRSELGSSGAVYSELRSRELGGRT